MKINTGLDSAKDFLIWLREYEGIKNFSNHDAALLLGYLEGHGYALYVDRNRLFFYDVQGDTEHIESFQGIVHRVNQWIIEMITETLYKIMEVENDEVYKKEEEYLKKLLDDEEHLADICIKIGFIRASMTKSKER